MTVEIEAKIQRLADLIGDLGEELMHDTAQNAALLSAVAALVETHPDQQRFVQVFRKHWKLLAAPYLQEPETAATHLGAEGVLQVIEKSCAIPLDVRSLD